MGSKLTNEEVVLINNLTYCENLGGPKGTFLHPSQESRTIGDFVKGVFRNADQIIDDAEYSTGVTGAEYKEILRAIQKNEHLKEMIIQEVHYESESAGGGRSVFLIDPANNEAIVAFKGTQSDAEWIDNVSGLYRVPSSFQANALKWFRSLNLEGFDTITVTGHSKGGNKAKFITIMDDRVNSCFSFDGQGFSDEFIRKYSAEILRNRDKILNINAECDFVNILLNDVGKREFYLGTNYGRLGFAENHCANAILFFDNEGNVSLWKAKGQDKKMADLDKMLNSFIRTCRMTTREGVANMLGNVIVNASNGNTEGLLNIFSDAQYKESAAKLVAYILRYKEERPEMVKSVKDILRQNGFSSGMMSVANFVTNHELIMKIIGKNPDSVIKILKMYNAPLNVTCLLAAHMELFDFIVLVSERMHYLTKMNFDGDDLDPAENVLTIGKKKRFYINKSKVIKWTILIAILIIVVIIFFI